MIYIASVLNCNKYEIKRLAKVVLQSHKCIKYIALKCTVVEH